MLTYLLSSSFSPPLAIVPILMGPLQALLALLPVVLAALGAALLAAFKPRNLWLLMRLLWRQKLAVALVAAAFLVGRWGWRQLGAPPGGGEARLGEAAPWPNFRGGPQRRGWQPGSPDPTAPGVQWAYQTSDNAAIYSSPAVVGDYVFFTTARITPFDATGSGRLLCLNAHTGELVWVGDLPDLRATFSSPSVLGEYLAVGEGLHVTRDSRVSLFRSGDGSLVWSHRTSSHAESTPVLTEDRVFAGSGRDGWRALNLEPDSQGQAEVVWQAPGEKYMDASGSPNHWNGRVYLPMGRWGGYGMACLDTESGEELWRVNTPYPVFSGPTLVPERNLALIGMGNGNFVLTAEQAMDSELEWLRGQGADQAQLAAARERLGPAGEVWAVDLQTGENRWRFATARTVLGQVAAGDDDLYFAARDGMLYRLDYAGRELARWNARAPIVASPALAEHHVYIVSTAGILYCLEKTSLRVVWEAVLQRGPLTEADLFISSPTVAHGRIYVGTPRAGLLAIGEPIRPPPPLWPAARGPSGGTGRLDSRSLPDAVEELWFQPWPESQEPSLTASPALHEDAVYLAFANQAGGQVVRWPRGDRPPGAPDWSIATELPARRDLVGDGQRLFFTTGDQGDRDRQLLALNARDGQVVWQASLDPAAQGGLLLDRESLYVADHGLRAVEPGTGVVQWRRDDIVPVGRPALGQGRLAVSAGDRHLLLDAATGLTLWSKEREKPRDNFCEAAPVFVDHDRIVLIEDEHLLVVSELNGERQYTITLEDSTRPALAPMILEQGLLGVWDNRGNLRVFDLAERGREQFSIPDQEHHPVADDAAVIAMGRRGMQRLPLDGGRGTGWLRWDEDHWGQPLAAPLAGGGQIVIPTSRGLLKLAARP